MTDHNEQEHLDTGSGDRRQTGAGEADLPGVTTERSNSDLRALVRGIALEVLEDQSATFVREGNFLRMHGLQRRELVEFSADVIASRVADALKASP